MENQNSNLNSKPASTYLILAIIIFLILGLFLLNQNEDGITDDVDLSHQDLGSVPIEEGFGGELDFTEEQVNDPFTQQQQSEPNPINNQTESNLMVDKTKLAQPVMIIDPNKEYTAVMTTSEGSITLRLFADQTPVTVNNFVYLAKEGFYNDLIFHRIIEDFMIQGGCPLGNGTSGPGYQFQDEQNSKPLVKGSLAMANSGPNTNGSQFFIVTAQATPWLDGLHTHFGQVIEGMNVVDKIAQTETGANDRPIQPVIIQSITVSEN